MLARSIGEHTGHNLAQHVPRLKPPRPRTNIATTAQLSALLATAEPWLRVFLTLTSTLALRHAEALDVRPAGFDNEHHTVTFKAKGGELQQMPTTEEIEALFANAPPGDPTTPLLELYRGSKVTPHTISYTWRRLKKRCGIRADLVPHDLRRTAAVTGYDLTKDLRFVQQLLRHRNLSTTARYLEHRDPQKLRSLLAQMWTHKPPETIQ